MKGHREVTLPTVIDNFIPYSWGLTRRRRASPDVFEAGLGMRLKRLCFFNSRRFQRCRRRRLCVCVCKCVCSFVLFKQSCYCLSTVEFLKIGRERRRGEKESEEEGEGEGEGEEEMGG